MRRALSHLADLPALAALVALAALFAQTVRGRIATPWDLEWMEGGMLLHAQRVLDGLPLYSAPSLDWIPFIYPPLYPWLVAAAGAAVGLDYEVGRALSVVGTALACLALVWGVRREGGSWLLGTGAAALFLSCYEDSGTFYDLVRTDGVLVGLLGWSLLSIRHRRPVVGGLLLVLAFMAKQNAALFGLPALVWLWRVRGRSEALRFALASVGPALLFLGAMQLVTDGLFLVYLVEVPGHHPFVLERFFPGTLVELWQGMPWALGLLGVAVLLPPVLRRLGRLPAPADPEWTAGVAYWAAMLGTGVLLCMVMRGHHGGFLNVLVPGYWLLAMVAALGAQALRRRLDHPAVVLLTSAVLALSAWQGRWELERTQPTDADRQAYEQVLETLRGIEGDVFMPHSPWLLTRVGKTPGFHLIALWDLDHGGALSPAVDLVRQGIAERRWAAIVLPNEKLGYGLKDHYRITSTVRYSGKALYPKTGWQVRPRQVYTPLPW